MYCNGKNSVAKVKVTVTYDTYLLKQLNYVNKMCKIIILPDSRVRFVRPLNFDHLKIKMAAVTLGNGSRSNGWYGSKVMVGIIIWHIDKNLLVKSL